MCFVACIHYYYCCCCAVQLLYYYYYCCNVCEYYFTRAVLATD